MRDPKLSATNPKLLKSFQSFKSFITHTYLVQAGTNLLVTPEKARGTSASPGRKHLPQCVLKVHICVPNYTMDICHTNKKSPAIFFRPQATYTRFTNDVYYYTKLINFYFIANL